MAKTGANAGWLKRSGEKQTFGKQEEYLYSHARIHITYTFPHTLPHVRIVLASAKEGDAAHQDFQLHQEKAHVLP